MNRTTTAAELEFYDLILTQQRRLEIAFRLRPLDEGDAAILCAEWCRALVGWTTAEVVEAVDAWIDSAAEFPPRVGQILRLASDRALGAPTLDEALRRIEFARQRGIDPADLFDDCPAARIAIAAAGEGLRHGSEVPIFLSARKVFIETLDRALERERIELVGQRRRASVLIAPTARALGLAAPV